MAVRLADVAELAGVSAKTVSNVVHNLPFVRAEIRERVQSAIDELGYRPNLHARRLVTGRTTTIMIALPRLDVPYFGELSMELTEAAKALGYRTMIEQTLLDPSREVEALQVRELGVADGLLMQPAGVDSLATIRPDLPVVLIGEVEPPSGLDHVMIDNERMAARVVQALANQGRRRIAYLAPAPEVEIPSAERRRAGYKLGHRRARQRLDPDLTLSTDGRQFGQGELVVANAWDAGIRFDAILCHDDTLAIGATRALAERGVNVGRDVAIVGWDDILMAAQTYPSLTSVSPDKGELARTALTMLIERVEGYEGPGRHVITPATLAIRESAPELRLPAVRARGRTPEVRPQVQPT